MEPQINREEVLPSRWTLLHEWAGLMMLGALLVAVTEFIGGHWNNSFELAVKNLGGMIFGALLLGVIAVGRYLYSAKSGRTAAIFVVPAYVLLLVAVIPLRQVRSAAGLARSLGSVPTLLALAIWLVAFELLRRFAMSRIIKMREAEAVRAAQSVDDGNEVWLQHLELYLRQRGYSIAQARQQLLQIREHLADTSAAAGHPIMAEAEFGSPAQAAEALGDTFKPARKRRLMTETLTMSAVTIFATGSAVGLISDLRAGEHGWTTYPLLAIFVLLGAATASVAVASGRSWWLLRKKDAHH